MYLLSFFNHEEERGFGGVDDIEFSSEDAASIVSGKKLFHHFAFYRAFVVTGVNCNDKASVALKKLDSGLNGGNGGFVQSGNAFIAAGKKTEVEHTYADLAVNIFLDLVMRIADQSIVLRRVVFFEQFVGRIESGLLDIKSVNLTVCANGSGKKEGIVSIAHGEVYGGASAL